ncbi:MAG: hypothetical protein H0V31_00165 [Acidobacteria bacterium]|jgi:hypothetical protein|nr:hypothetical protein [Acidobacteriota bacterium]
MSQVLEQDTIQSDEFYKQEVHRMLDEMERKNEKIKHDQEEIDWLKKQSLESLKRIDQNLKRIEGFLQ